MFSKDDLLENILATAIASLLLIYVFFFLFLPQSWTLNNDYGWLLTWRSPISFWPGFHGLNQGDLSSGRFHPVYNFFITSAYCFLPLKPVVFRFLQIILFFSSAIVLADILKLFKFEKIQILIAELLFVGNLTIKDWIVLPAAFEPLAVLFFLLSVDFFLRKKKFISALLFICSFLSKESFFDLLPVFLFLETLDFVRSKKRTYSLKQAWPVAIFVVSTIGFCIFVKHLPRVYTAGKFSSLSLKGILEALALPPLKAYAPALVLGGVALYENKKRQFQPGEMAAIGVGALIVICQTLILVAWGPFNSWFYLHMAIPIGWALILAGICTPSRVSLNKPITSCLVVAACVYLLFLTLNGSFHRWTDLANARTAAEIACEDFDRTPNLALYSNCEEGASELHNYLIAYNVCQKVPDIHFTGEKGLNLNPKSPSEFLFSPLCNGPKLQGTPKYELKLQYWTIQKYF